MNQFDESKEKLVKEEFLQMRTEIADDVLDLKELPGDLIVDQLDKKRLLRDSLLDIKDPKERLEKLARL